MSKRQRDTPHAVRPFALRPADAAKALSIDRSTLYRMEKQGRIFMSRSGGITWVPVSEIERLLGQPPNRDAMAQAATSASSLRRV